MKTLKILMMLALMTIATSATAMSYRQAKQQARYLADKMAYELDLTDAQYQAAYELNLDYLMADADHYDRYWSRRNRGLEAILATWQFSRFVGLDYLYRPHPHHRPHYIAYRPAPRPHHHFAPAPRPHGPRGPIGPHRGPGRGHGHGHHGHR